MLMPENDDKAGAVRLCAELDGPELRWGDDVACDTDREEPAEPLVEHGLRRGAMIAATQDDGDRMIVGGVVYLKNYGSSVNSSGRARGASESLSPYHENNVKFYETLTRSRDEEMRRIGENWLEKHN